MYYLNHDIYVYSVLYIDLELNLNEKHGFHSVLFKAQRQMVFTSIPSLEFYRWFVVGFCFVFKAA